MTTHSAGESPRPAAAARKMSGAGLLRLKPVTLCGGKRGRLSAAEFAQVAAVQWQR